MVSSGYFVRAVGDRLVNYKEPVFDWEMTDDAWYFWDFVPCGSEFFRSLFFLRYLLSAYALFGFFNQE